jgi:signal transduction histidine kinase
MGMSVVGTTGSGEEAIALADAHVPDLVLMDIRLRGGIDGISAASAIRERANVPVVFITAHADPTTIERAKRAAPLGYLIKPFNERDLHVAIEMALHKRATDRMAHKLMEAQRLESLGRLAEGVARDLGNVLVPILGNVRLAAEHADAGSRLRRQLDSINAAAERASELCRQMREYAGGGATAISRLSLDQVIAEIEHLVRAAAAQRIAAFELGCGSIEVEVDRAQIQQLVMNLVVNAFEALHESGAVTLTTHPRTVDAGEIEGLPGGDYAVIDIHDTGTGMDDETQTRIFEPFFTTKAVGRGLGLASAQGIVRAHHGVITVISAPAQGATFCVYLPVARTTTGPAGN